MSDERKGCPSASAFKQYADCPGSFTLSKLAPEEAPSPGAARGTRVHSAMAGEVNVSTLVPDEQQTVCELSEQEEVLLDTFTRNKAWEVHSIKVEERLWGDATESRWSGKADKVYILKNAAGEKAALVVDYKSTRYTDKADKNLQLAGLCALVDGDNDRGLDKVFVALVYPDGYDQAVYDVDAIEEATVKCKALVDSVTITHTDTRVPSAEACKYCKGKSICPEIKGELNGLVKVEPATLSVTELSKLLKSCGVAEALIREIRSQAKAVLESGGEIAGWELKPGHTRSKITDTEEVYRRAAVLGIDGATFSKQVSISKKDLANLVRDGLGYKGKEATETVKNLVEGCTTDTVTSASLKEVKA